MRRLMLLLFVVGFVGSMAGCHLMHTHGICDCAEDNHCLERAPWLHYGGPVAAETIAVPPIKLPEGKKKDL